MQKFSKFICRHRVGIIILSLILLIPSIFGYISTKVNYDLLVYLPSDIETLKGQEILTEDFGTGAFSVAAISGLAQKELLQLEDNVRTVDGVKDVLSVADLTGSAIPVDFLPSEIREKVAHEDYQLMMITFEDGTSDERTLNAVSEIRRLANGSCLLGGMSAMVLDTKELFNSETILYVIIAVVLSIIVLLLFLDSYVVPFLLIAGIGFALVYNMGTNFFLGEISYVTKAISAVLQLGVTMDFSIFLYHSYEAAKKKESDRLVAMSRAICATAESVVGSALTTFAGFLALCTMSLTLGTDIGIVMAKGVVLGVLCAITILPALLLVCDTVIEKTHHKSLLPKFHNVQNFVLKHRKIILAIFVVAFIPALILQAKTPVYYKLDSSIPDDYEYTKSMNILRDEFGMESQMIVLVDSKTTPAEITSMSQEIDEIEGVSAVLSLESLNSYGLSTEMLSESLRDSWTTENHTAVLVLSNYGIATNELNAQIVNIDDIVTKYDEGTIVAGEGPLMKDLVEISDRDFTNVNLVSIVIIFIIMMCVLRSILLPVLLMAAIEFAIFLNLGVVTLTGSEIPFIASIVIGTIQLGATIDYAILLTTKYLAKRKNGDIPTTAAHGALSESIQPIFVSAMCFFAATIGVGLISEIDMVGSLCTLIGRGAVISMIVVVTIIPSLLITCDKLIMKTTAGVKKRDLR